MSTRIQDFGIDVAISRRIMGKYDPQPEQEVLGWINQLTGINIPVGMENVRAGLKNGQVLVKLINCVFERTPNLPPMAQSIKRPIHVNTGMAPFKQMENIQNFLNGCFAYGVPKESLFQTVDLYENRNMAQVLNTILKLGSEGQRHGFQGPVVGPKPVIQQKRQFTMEQLRSGEGTIGLQAGTNKFASQKGMSIGAVRHIADIRCDNLVKEGSDTIGLQMGTNKFASQKGMSMGNQRHIADIRCDDMTKEGSACINLQMGTNQFASQKGMRMGASRHIADIPVEKMNKNAENIISLQYGTNQFANQNGMRMGAIRHITDISCGVEPNTQSSNQISLQMGPSMSQVANQSGMSFGAQRHIKDSH